MTVKEFQDQLRLAKNKDAEVLFRVGNDTLKLEIMVEVVSDSKGVHFPSLGETANALAIKLEDNRETSSDKSE